MHTIITRGLASEHVTMLTKRDSGMWDLSSHFSNLRMTSAPDAFGTEQQVESFIRTCCPGERIILNNSDVSIGLTWVNDDMEVA